MDPFRLDSKMSRCVSSLKFIPIQVFSQQIPLLTSDQIRCFACNFFVTNIVEGTETAHKRQAWRVLRWVFSKSVIPDRSNVIEGFRGIDIAY